MEAITATVAGKTVIFDAEDMPLYAAHKWRISPSGYLRRNGEHKNIEVMFHREVIKAPVFSEVDHANGDTLDNRKTNLRFCTRAQNMQNQKPKSGASIYKGVGRHKGAWRARIELADKRLDLGRYSTEVEATLAYDYFAARMFGQFARLNNPPTATLTDEARDRLQFFLDVVQRRNIARTRAA